MREKPTVLNRASARSADAEPERTEVRARQVESAQPPPANEGVAPKLERARALLRGLDPRDPRARLLQVALLRRDEVLLEALLRRFDSLAPPG
jgi:hypothetical protein